MNKNLAKALFCITLTSPSLIIGADDGTYLTQEVTWTAEDEQTAERCYQTVVRNQPDQEEALATLKGIRSYPGTYFWAKLIFEKYVESDGQACDNAKSMLRDIMNSYPPALCELGHIAIAEGEHKAAYGLFTRSVLAGHTPALSHILNPHYPCEASEVATLTVLDHFKAQQHEEFVFLVLLHGFWRLGQLENVIDRHLEVVEKVRDIQMLPYVELGLACMNVSIAQTIFESLSGHLDLMKFARAIAGQARTTFQTFASDDARVNLVLEGEELLAIAKLFNLERMVATHNQQAVMAEVANEAGLLGTHGQSSIWDICGW